MKKLVILVASSLALVVLAAVPVMAQEASYQFVQGTITYVSPSLDQIRVEETDGSLTDFWVAPETSTSQDLAVGQEVEVGFYKPLGPELMIYPPQRTADQITIL